MFEVTVPQSCQRHGHALGLDDFDLDSRCSQYLTLSDAATWGRVLFPILGRGRTLLMARVSSALFPTQSSKHSVSRNSLDDPQG